MLPEYFVSTLRAYNLSRNSFLSHLSAAPVDNTCTRREQEVCFIPLCFAQRRWSVTSVQWVSGALTTATAEPSKSRCQWRVRHHYEHPLLSWTGTQVPSGSTQDCRTAASMLTGPRRCGFSIPIPSFGDLAISNLLGKQTTTLFFQIPWHRNTFPVVVPGVKRVQWVKL